MFGAIGMIIDRIAAETIIFYEPAIMLRAIGVCIDLTAGTITVYEAESDRIADAISRIAETIVLCGSEYH